MRWFRLGAENNLGWRLWRGGANNSVYKGPLVPSRMTKHTIQPSNLQSHIHETLPYHTMKSFLISLLALALAVSAAPAPHDKHDGGDSQCACIGTTCDTIGDMQCCGTGFVTCDYSGWVYRDCGPGTTCYQLPAPGPLYCGYPAGEPAP
jgi:hypothetical protein